MKDKHTYFRNLHKRIDDWNADIDKLKAEADELEAESCDECLRQLKSLREKSEQTKQMVAEMQAAGEAALEDLKAGVQTV